MCRLMLSDQKIYGGFCVDRNALYRELNTMQNHYGAVKENLVKEGYYILSESGVPSLTVKAERFLKDYEQTYIKKVEKFLRDNGSINQSGMNELFKICNDNIILLIKRLIYYHNIIKENKDGTYSLV